MKPKHGNSVVDIADYRTHEVTWRYRAAPERNCLIGIYGREDGTECACILNCLRGEVLALLELADDTDPAIALVLNWISGAVIQALGRPCVVEVEAPAQPAWMA